MLFKRELKMFEWLTRQLMRIITRVDFALQSVGAAVERCATAASPY